MNKTQQLINDNLSVKEIKNQWNYQVEDNYTTYRKAVQELQKKHHAIYVKIQDKTKEKLGYKVGRDVECEMF